MNNLQYDNSKSHVRNAIEAAANAIPALRQQERDGITISEIDKALTVYQEQFTSRQWNFVANYASGMTLVQSLTEAGYLSPTRRQARDLLDSHGGHINHAYQLLLKRRYLSDGVEKRWVVSKLEAIVEESHDKGHLRVAIAALRELSDICGLRMPVQLDIKSAVSVEYHLLHLGDTPVIKEISADLPHKPSIIEAQPLSDCALEFLNYAVPEI